MPNNPSERSGLSRSAIFLMSIGEDAAAEIFRHLTTREAQQLGTAMAGLKQVSREEVTQVMEDFRVEAEQFMAVTLGSDDYIRSVLTKALGNDRAASLLEDILDSGNANNGIDTLNWLDAATVAELIGDEHPQIIATILVHLDRGHAAAILEMLTERLRNDVMLRIATFGGVQPSALTELTDVLNSVLAGQGAKRSKMGGIRTAAEILNLMSGSEEDTVLGSLRERDADLAQRIQDEMFTFENLIELEDRGVQLLLKEVDNDTLMVALKGVPDELRDKFLRNMSTRAAEILREDLEAQGPIRMSKVEAEQKKILVVARRLAESGQVVLGNSGGDAYV